MECMTKTQLLVRLGVAKIFSLIINFEHLINIEKCHYLWINLETLPSISSARDLPPAADIVGTMQWGSRNTGGVNSAVSWVGVHAKVASMKGLKSDSLSYLFRLLRPPIPLAPATPSWFSPDSRRFGGYHPGQPMMMNFSSLMLGMFWPWLIQVDAILNLRGNWFSSHPMLTI